MAVRRGSQELDDTPDLAQELDSRVAMIYTTLAFHVAGLKVQGATSTFRRSLLAFLFTAEGHCANPSFTNPNLLHWLWFGHFSSLGFVVRYDAS